MALLRERQEEFLARITRETGRRRRRRNDSIRLLKRLNIALRLCSCQGAEWPQRKRVSGFDEAGTPHAQYQEKHSAAHRQSKQGVLHRVQRRAVALFRRRHGSVKLNASASLQIGKEINGDDCSGWNQQ